MALLFSLVFYFRKKFLIVPFMFFLKNFSYVSIVSIDIVRLLLISSWAFKEGSIRKILFTNLFSVIMLYIMNVNDFP